MKDLEFFSAEEAQKDKRKVQIDRKKVQKEDGHIKIGKKEKT
jgi:hypothetical protein